jgi:hypothetical protein
VYLEQRITHVVSYEIQKKKKTLKKTRKRKGAPLGWGGEEEKGTSKYLIKN